MKPLLLATCLLLAACASAPRAATDAPPASPPKDSAPLVCTQDADCEIKNVGNCCGYFPACVHRDQAVDPEGVKARCEKEGMASVCGFAEITACSCEAGQCRAAGNDGAGRLD